MRNGHEKSRPEAEAAISQAASKTTASLAHPLPKRFVIVVRREMRNGRVHEHVYRSAHAAEKAYNSARSEGYAASIQLAHLEPATTTLDDLTAQLLLTDLEIMSNPGYTPQQRANALETAQATIRNSRFFNAGDCE